MEKSDWIFDNILEPGGKSEQNGNAQIFST